MRLSLLFPVLLCLPCYGQTVLPNAPSSTRAWAISVGENNKYSFRKDSWDFIPKVVLDYRFNPRLRVGLEYSHAVYAQENAVSVGVNYKVLEWGRKR